MNITGFICRYVGMVDESITASLSEICPQDSDPEWIPVDSPAFDEMWAGEEAGPSSDGYLNRPVWP